MVQAVLLPRRMWGGDFADKSHLLVLLAIQLRIARIQAGIRELGELFVRELLIGGDFTLAKKVSKDFSKGWSFPCPMLVIIVAVPHKAG